ncbi:MULTISPECIES: hypothetical protein [Xenorhabdus]|nr:hypothetical protein [Xenorhabdus indica]
MAFWLRSKENLWERCTDRFRATDLSTHQEPFSAHHLGDATKHLESYMVYLHKEKIERIRAARFQIDRGKFDKFQVWVSLVTELDSINGIINFKFQIDSYVDRNWTGIGRVLK